jgi:phospholipid-binding lipoprotein MlaA
MKLIFMMCAIFICLFLSSSQIFAVSPGDVLEKSLTQTEEGKNPHEQEKKPLVTDQEKPDAAKAEEPKSVASGNNEAEEEGEEETVKISDPLRPWNNAMYHFNDKLYFWILKPVARGYSEVVPEDMRLAVSNFFSNLSMPIRFISSLLQLKIKNAGNELLRFVYNTTAGVGGLADAAKLDFGIKQHDEDLGQTLGSYGIGHGFYLVWPFLGPSSLRDTIGRVGDGFLDPVSYVTPWESAVGIKVYDEVNETTFHIGDYEDLKKSAIDPYVSLRDAYVQYRKKKVEETDTPVEGKSQSSKQPVGQPEAAQMSMTKPEPDKQPLEDPEPTKQLDPVPETAKQPTEQTESAKQPGTFFKHAETFFKLPEPSQKQVGQKPLEKKELLKSSIPDNHHGSKPVHVQIGLFKNRNNAEDFKEKYKKKGYDTFTLEGPTKQPGVIYRVLIGNFRNKKEAAQLASEIRSTEKIDAIIYHE